MPLVTLKAQLVASGSALRNLEFGHDEYKGGSSGEPFVTSKIPAPGEDLPSTLTISGDDVGKTLLTGFVGALGGGLIGGIAGGTGGALGTGGAALGATLGAGSLVGLLSINRRGLDVDLSAGGTGGPDFLLRGGYLVANRVIADEVRLYKFLFTDVKGILFNTKQGLLSKVAVRTQASPAFFNGGTYNPLSTLIEAAGLPLGIHANKQGLNPFAGAGEAYTPGYYFDALKDNSGTDYNLDKNRLNVLFKKKIIQYQDEYDLSGNIKIDNGNVNILSYSGGPGSFLGIGPTNIKYATDNVGAPLSIRPDSTIKNDTSGENYATFDYSTLNDIKSDIENYVRPKVIDFRKKIQTTSTTLFSDAPPYSGAGAANIEQRVKLGDPGNPSGKNLTSYVTGSYTTTGQAFGAASQDSYDKINYSVIYNSTSEEANVKAINTKRGDLNDLVQFRIGVFNLKDGGINYIHFRAFLENISDTYKSNWEGTQYIGRGEKFYNYTGFDRTVSLSWVTAAQSKAELIPMYKKLNYLASVCAPDYSPSGYMRGNIVTLTVGGYFYEQPGIINGFSYEMNDNDATWEIAIDEKGTEDTSVKQLPHLIKVSSFNFTPIHTFVPRLQQLSFDKDSGDITGSYGQERYISLANGVNNNY